MGKIDTSGWNIARVDLGGGFIINGHTLNSEEEINDCCKRYGYKLLSFEKGVNGLCEIELPDSVHGMTVKAPELPKVEIPEDWDI